MLPHMSFHWLRGVMSQSRLIYKEPLSHTDGRPAQSSFTQDKEGSAVRRHILLQTLVKPFGVIFKKTSHHVQRTRITAYHLPGKVRSTRALWLFLFEQDSIVSCASMICCMFLTFCLFYFYRAKELKALFGSLLLKSDHSITAQSKKNDKLR